MHYKMFYVCLEMQFIIHLLFFVTPLESIVRKQPTSESANIILHFNLGYSYLKYI